MEKHILQATNRLLTVITNEYGIDIGSKLTISLDLKGTAAGKAIHFILEDRYAIQLNKEAGLEYLLSETLPHELAHLLQAALGGKMDHGAAWKFYCKQLGGSGNTTHTLDLTPTRRTREFLYVVDGMEYTLSIIRHNKIQKKGIEYTDQKHGKVIQKQHFVQEIL